MGEVEEIVGRLVAPSTGRTEADLQADVRALLLAAAERSFRRVRGHKELPKLREALRRHATGVEEEVGDSPIAA